ncbi:MAG: LytTR family DNA-binding domain-containing protein [Bacteroidales bacterium]|nr:LytTR family DNA-binding domain-containing protein [Bacteroidales bacterium]
MKALIIEDEPMARASLIRLLGQNFPDIEVIGTLASVKAAVAWFREPSNRTDIVFLDVELSDGNCFEIFRQTEVRGNVIMTTAYDRYAVKAFEINSVDYLLKPVEAEALRRAVGRVAEKLARASVGGFDVEKLASALAKSVSGGAPAEPEYRRRFVVRFNDKIIPVETSALAYFYSEDKNTFMVTREGSSYIIDLTLDEVSEQVDPAAFFRVSRRCVMSMGAIRSITKQLGGRLRLEVAPAASFEVTVSRSRSDDFLRWIER